MPEVVTAACRRGSLQLFGPFAVGLGEPPHLIGGQAQVTEHRAERLAVVDCSRSCFRTSTGEPRLRIASEACFGCVVLRFMASVAVTPFQPAGHVSCAA
jgi:hypothetical protein